MARKGSSCPPDVLARALALNEEAPGNVSALYRRLVDEFPEGRVPGVQTVRRALTDALAHPAPALDVTPERTLAQAELDRLLGPIAPRWIVNHPGEFTPDEVRRAYDEHVPDRRPRRDDGGPLDEVASPAPKAPRVTTPKPEPQAAEVNVDGPGGLGWWGRLKARLFEAEEDDEAEEGDGTWTRADLLAFVEEKGLDIETLDEADSDDELLDRINEALDAEEESSERGSTSEAGSGAKDPAAPVHALSGSGDPTQSRRIEFDCGDLRIVPPGIPYRDNRGRGECQVCREWKSIRSDSVVGAL